MPIGSTNLKSVQQDRDAVREQLPHVSWAGGSYIKDPQILDNANVVTAAGLIGAGGGGDTTALEAEIASLQAQLAQTEAALAIAEADLADALAQVAADAITIASLQSQVSSLQAQVALLQAQVSSLQAQAVIDAATIASLQSQVTTLTGQVATLTAQVASLQDQLNKIFKVVVINTFASDAGGIYVPPVYNDVTQDYTSVLKLGPYIINTFANTTGGFP